MACDLVEAGGLRLADTVAEADELAATAALLHDEGVAHRLLTRDALQAVFPAAEGYHGALELQSCEGTQPLASNQGRRSLSWSR